MCFLEELIQCTNYTAQIRSPCLLGCLWSRSTCKGAANQLPQTFSFTLLFVFSSSFSMYSANTSLLYSKIQELPRSPFRTQGSSQHELVLAVTSTTAPQREAPGGDAAALRGEAGKPTAGALPHGASGRCHPPTDGPAPITHLPPALGG